MIIMICYTYIAPVGMYFAVVAVDNLNYIKNTLIIIFVHVAIS